MPYLDSAYIAKCYVNDLDSERVRDLVRLPAPLYSSALCVPEVTCAIHRKYREGGLNRKEMLDLTAMFREHVERGTWTLVPVSESLLWAVHEALRDLRNTVYIRSADATHLVSARTAGFADVWTSDKRMLEAATHFGLSGKSV